MKIEHIALWTNNLEKMKDFYTKYFAAKANDKYTSKKNNFQSYFLTFSSGARLELMNRLELNSKDKDFSIGLTHTAFSVGSKENVDSLTVQLIDDGYQVIGNPRTTGDGYYESSVYDPDGNIVEITI